MSESKGGLDNPPGGDVEESKESGFSPTDAVVVKAGQKGSSESVSDEFEILAKPETGSSDDVVLLSKEEIVDGGKPNTDDNEDKHPENKQKEEKEEEQTVFNKIYFLGNKGITDPKDEKEIQKMMAEIDSSSTVARCISLTVPTVASKSVLVRDTDSQNILISVKIQSIIFFARGDVSSDQKNCFAFTAATDKADGYPTRLQCFIFRCEIHDAIEKVFKTFAKAFNSEAAGDNIDKNVDKKEEIVFEIGLELREDDGKGNFVYVPRDKDSFKIRSNVQKHVVVSLCQVSDNNKLKVERCFGMLVSPGRNVRHSDMQLLEQVQVFNNSSGWSFQGTWDPKEAAFAVLNQETGPDLCVYMTIAVDLVISNITEPVRFVLENKVKIFASNERFWYYTRRTQIVRYHLFLRRTPDTVQLLEVRPGTEVEQQQGRLSALLASGLASWRGEAIEEPSVLLNQDDDSDTDELVLSGSGEVSKECTEAELDTWGEVLKLWAPGQTRPKMLGGLVRAGIPDALRGEVWQRLSGASEVMDVAMENYRILVSKDSPDDKVIKRDIHRTFPANDFFKEAGGVGQEALFRISKAYSVYDSEIGYCQGQSFLIAALLLQMPEEQAFGVLVQIMQRYGLRDMFRENFEQLQLRFYQLQRLVETRLPDLHTHFQEIGIETHMYASQWFLTLFSAKFPLFLVFRVLDAFLMDGVEVLFQVSLALLMTVRKELLAQDFETAMKYFRVNIPKRMRSEEHAKSLMKTACSIKIKKLNKYQKEWSHIKEAERMAEDPLTRFQKENKKLMADTIRLERENDQLAQQLLTSKISMMADIDRLEDLKETLEKDLSSCQQMLEDNKQESQLLGEEVDQLKLLLKREVQSSEEQIRSKDNIINEYKQITRDLSEKLNNKITTPEERKLVEGENSKKLDNAMTRIQELELELAQTKLALVETECKNQDLTHQFTTQESTNNRNSTWFSKTLTSIKEAAAGGQGQGQKSAVPGSGSPPDTMRKSTSEHTVLTHQRSHSGVK